MFIGGAAGAWKARGNAPHAIPMRSRQMIVFIQVENASMMAARGLWGMETM
jgi:hypothetical protein